MLRSLALWTVPALAWCAAGLPLPTLARAAAPVPPAAVAIGYLEVVTPDVEATCRLLEAQHGVAFGEPEAALGNARTAALAGGGRIGVRAPLSETEGPVVRPYLLVDDVPAALERAEQAGAVVAHPPLALEGHGTFAIHVLGGIQHGLWQDPPRAR